MTFTSKTSEPTLRVPFGWDVIEGGEDVSFKSEAPPLLKKENTSSLLTEAQADSHPGEVGQE